MTLLWCSGCPSGHKIRTTMLHKKFKETLKDKLGKATDSELRVIANGDEQDAKEVANKILLDRMNKNRNRKRGIGATDEDFEG